MRRSRCRTRRCRRTDGAVAASLSRPPLGGAFRAGTTSPENEPCSEKDPIAYGSYHRCRASPELISALFPKHFPPSGTE